LQNNVQEDFSLVITLHLPLWTVSRPVFQLFGNTLA